MVVQQLNGRCMGENKKEEANVEMTKEVAFAVSSSSVSDSSCDTTLPKQASLHGRTTGPTRRSTKGGWTEEEDDILTKVVKTFNGKNWKKIAEYFPGRSDVQCLHRWQKVLNPDLVKGPWTKEEDDHIIELVGKYGCKKWSVIAQSLPGRIGKQCRERWHNHLNPAIKKDAWTKDEEMALIRAHQIYGNKWAEIARYLPGRADNSIKNHWNCSVKKKLDSYSASALASDIPCVGIPDSNSNGRREQYIKPKLSTLSLGAVGFKISGKDDISTCLDVSLLGNSKGGEKDPHSNPVKIENSVFLKIVDDMRSEKGAPSSSLISNHPEVHANHASMSDDLRSSTIHHTVSYGMSLDGSTNIFSPRCSRGPMNRINCLSPRYSSEYVTLGTSTNVPAHANFSSRKKIISPGIVFPVPANRLHESPEKSCQFPSPMSGSSSMDSRFNSECNCIPSSMLVCEFGSDTGGVHRQGKVPALHVQSEEMSSCSSFYNSPPLNNLAHGGSSSIKNCIQQIGSLADFSTPPSGMRSISVNGSNPDPDLILRNAAKSFTTPSIIRKRKRATSRVIANGSGHNGFCTPDVKSSRNKDMQDSTHSCPPVCGGQYDLSNVKWLSLSPRSSLRPDTSSKSLEKRLEHEFDMEWDKSKAKCSTSAIASDSSDTNQGTNTGFTPLDNSPDSLGVGSDQNSIHVDSSGNCNFIT